MSANNKKIKAEVLSKQTIKNTAAPDPFWPEGAVPQHLSKAAQASEAVMSRFGVDITTAWHCSKCGSADLTQRSLLDQQYCNKCYLVEKSNSSLAKRVNPDWMAQSAELGLAIYERQPEETDLEWYIWCKYRDHYPLRMPSWKELAEKCDCSVATCVKASQKWSFKVRLQAWARMTDDEMLEDRVHAIKEMNQRQLQMAKELQGKIQQAIGYLDPALLKPNELVNLFKMVTELERKIVTAMPERVETTVQEAGQKQRQVTKVEDLGEIVDILQKAGMLENKAIGVEQKVTTQTTRIIAKE